MGAVEGEQGKNEISYRMQCKNKCSQAMVPRQDLEFCEGPQLQDVEDLGRNES